jgi:hypothetical protein
MNFGRLAKIKKNPKTKPTKKTTKKSKPNNSNNEIYEIIRQNKTINSENKYEIKTKNYIFQVNKKRMKSGDEYYEIFNKKGRTCVKIAKYHDNEEIIYLQHLNYYESCSKNKSLIRKYGTLEMLNGILEFVNRESPLKKYYFEDDSMNLSKRSGDKELFSGTPVKENSSIRIEGEQISLNILYVLLYGETWYMININAIPLDMDFIEKLERINNYLINNKDELIAFLKIDKEEEIINKDKLNKILSNSNNKNIKIKGLKRIYEESITSRDFLQKLYKIYGMGIFLLVNYYGYYEYINRKIHSKLNFNIEFEIPKEYIKEISVIRDIKVI